MQAVFKSELDTAELEKIQRFCNSVDYFSIEQSIGWLQIFYKPKIRYFYQYDDTGIKCFCQIEEKFKSAHIFYGPVCCDRDIMTSSLIEIIQYYKKRGYYYLGVQLYYKSGYDTDFIEYSLNKKYNIKYIFDSENTHTSYEISLDKSVEEIWCGFREDHRKSIRKALKSGVVVDTLKTSEELDAFTAINTKMCKARDIPDDELPGSIIKKIFDYLTTNNKGQFLIVKDVEGIMVGGIIIIYQGNTIRMYKGASDPERRDLPIAHLLVYEIVQRAKEKSFKYIDLWGYNHFVDKDHQVYNINKFKKGFGGYCTFFAKKMNINLFPNGHNIFRSLSFIKYLFRKIPLKY